MIVNSQFKKLKSKIRKDNIWIPVCAGMTAF